MTYKDSIALAKKLRKLSPAILQVGLFGSVLVKGRGRDVDFVVLVDNRLAKSWWNEERESIRVRWPDSLYKLRWIVKKIIPFAYSATVRERRHKKLKTSLNMLGIESETLTDSTGKMPDFEIFFAPIEWRVGTEINMDVMGEITGLADDRNTMGMLNRIAREAVIVA